jgi:hypothetical protein
MILSNVGTSALQVLSLGIGGANPADYGIVTAPNLPVLVPAGSAIALTVQFKPVGHGARSATLIVSSNATNAAMYNVPLNGTGTGPQLTATPNTLDFGIVIAGSTTSRTLTVQNTGEVTLGVNNRVFGGPGGADFSSPVAAPFTLAPNASMAMPVSWTPTALGMATATLTIVSDDPLSPNALVNLTGTADAPTVDGPSAAEMGTVQPTPIGCGCSLGRVHRPACAPLLALTLVALLRRLRRRPQGGYFISSSCIRKP